MLEQIAYEISRISERKQVVYVVSDLERLSAVSLSYGTGGGSSGSSSGGGGSLGHGIVMTSLMRDNLGKSPQSGDKTISREGYIESIEVHADGTRRGYATSLNPLDFGEMSLKIQEKGQKHKTTEYRDI